MVNIADKNNLVAICNQHTSSQVSIHIYGVFKKIDGKTSIFRVNLGM